MNLPAVVKQTGMSLSEAKVIHSRPTLIQDLTWRPRPLGWSATTEPAEQVVFSFYDGVLFQIAVQYDRNETAGLTNDDVIEAMSAVYGVAAKPIAPRKAAQDPYGEQEEALAQWQDSRYRFDLIRFSYGPSYKLIGVLKRLEAPAQAAILQARRLDELEAPQRDAARLASEEATAKTELEKARLANKPNFRP